MHKTIKNLALPTLVGAAAAIAALGVAATIYKPIPATELVAENDLAMHTNDQSGTWALKINHVLHSSPYDFGGCDDAAELAIANYPEATTIYCQRMTLQPTLPAVAMLKGEGCAGANGPIFAESESDLQTCRKIKRVALPVAATQYWLTKKD